MIERFKGIATAATKLTKREITEQTVRAWARRSNDPLPVEYLAGRPGIEEEKLRVWLVKQEGQRQRRPVSAASV